MDEDATFEAWRRERNTRWVIDWIRGEEEVCGEIRHLREVEPPFDRTSAIRAAILGHIGSLGLPMGGRMEFVARAIESFVASVDWHAVDEALS